jgi:undecaprenyl-diphosphatase
MDSVRCAGRKDGMSMKRNEKTHLLAGIGFLITFLLWTVLIRCIDVQAAGPGGTKVGFAAFNLWFHKLTGVHMSVYTITDWLGLVSIAVCLGFGVVGVFQLIRRKSLIRVDPDILLLGLYYILVILAYLVFEMVPINYRPILIDGALEASYPSSTTLLVLSVMPTLMFQVGRRCERKTVKRAVNIFVVLFSAFMVIGRSVSGVHWATDIVGSVLLSFGLFKLYQSGVTAIDLRNKNGVQ